MNEQMTPAERQYHAREAERIVESMKPIFEAVESAYLMEWARHAETTEAREAVWFRLQALRDVVKDLVARVQDGALAKQEEEYNQ